MVVERFSAMSVMPGTALPLLLGLVVGVLASSPLPEVDLLQGKVRGLYDRTLDGREIEAYWGIPYAKPPVGKYRFKESVPSSRWQGVLNATQPPPECLQYSHTLHLSERPSSGQEDCLYVNVFTPKIVGRGGRLLEVIVFIHGGAFMFYSCSESLPTVLLDRDIVLVTFNYRLGPLGFLSTGDSVVPGNNGLKDQVLALKWVQSNIQAFGGDPNKVTIAGNSAGSASVHYHLISPATKGLFHGAILQSGVALNPWAEFEGGWEKAASIADSLGCPTNESLLMIRCLRDRPAEHIVLQSQHFLKYLYNPFSPFAGVVEPAGLGAYLSESPWRILSSGLAHDVPILMSYTKDEGLYPAAEIVGVDSNLASLKTHLLEYLPHVLDFNYTLPPDRHLEVSNKILQHYKIDLDTEEGLQNFIDMVGDRLFVHGILKSADRHDKLSSAPVYLFRFSYRGSQSISSYFTDKDLLGVSHGDDLFYVLPGHHSRSQETPEDLRMTKYIMNLWADFARDRQLKDWPPGEFRELRSPDELVKVSLPDLSFWDTLGLEEHPETVRDEL